MSYRVVKAFYDLQDEAHPYEVGQEFPRPGKTVSDARIEELAGTKNRQRTPLIERVADPEPEPAPEPVPESDTQPKPKRTRKKKAVET